MSVGKHLLHRARAGERWDQIAWRYYRNVSLQPQLIEANRTLFTDTMEIPAFLSAGLIITVPIIEQPPVNPDLLPPWKRLERQT